MVNSSENRGRCDKSSLKSRTMQEIIYFCVPKSRPKKRLTEQNSNYPKKLRINHMIRCDLSRCVYRRQIPTSNSSIHLIELHYQTLKITFKGISKQTFQRKLPSHTENAYIILQSVYIIHIPGC